MTDYSDFVTQIKDYANRGDWSDPVVIGFIRQAEERFNAELRISRMIKIAAALVTGRCMELPDDWLESDLVLIGVEGTPNGLLPIVYKPRDEFFNLTDKQAYGSYTHVGRQIFFGGSPETTNGLLYELNYFAEVPVFSDLIDSWVYTKHSQLYLLAALSNADLHAVGEEDKAMGLAKAVGDMISNLNNQHLLAKASGSRLRRTRRRSFG